MTRLVDPGIVIPIPERRKKLTPQELLDKLSTIAQENLGDSTLTDDELCSLIQNKLNMIIHEFVLDYEPMFPVFFRPFRVCKSVVSVYRGTLSINATEDLQELLNQITKMDSVQIINNLGLSVR